MTASLMRVILVAGVLAAAMLQGPAWAGKWDLTEMDPQFTFDAKIWHSSGSSEWSHNASSQEPTVGDPTSRLNYKNADSTIFELRGRADLSSRYFAELAYGMGKVNDGSLIDDDFLSATGADLFGATTRGQHIFSSTSSEIEGDDIRYLDLVIGRQLSTKRPINIFGQFLSWFENYSAQGIAQNICTVPNLLCFPAGSFDLGNQNVIENKTRWFALFFGADGTHEINQRFSVSARVALSPLAYLDNDDYHLLRTDLRQPSFNMSGFGYGFNTDINANYRITEKLSAHIGLRYWKLRVPSDGDGWRAFSASGGSTVAELNEFVSERKGMTFAISYEFGSEPNTF